jgi:ADP-ribose pyrophosphatase YjhB (NUDIX family)
MAIKKKCRAPKDVPGNHLAVCVLIIDPESKRMLVVRDDKYGWSDIGGKKRSASEGLQEAATRLCLAKTGLRPEHMTFVSQAFSPWCKADVRVYTASTETIENNIALASTLKEYKWVPYPLADSVVTPSFRLKLSVRNASSIISQILPTPKRTYEEVFGSK